MDVKIKICNNLKKDLYEKYKEDFKEKKISEDHLLEKIISFYEQNLKKYNKKIDEDFRIYIEALIEDEIVEEFNLHEVNIIEIPDLDDFDENKTFQQIQEVYNSTKQQILEEQIKKTKGPLNEEEKNFLANKNIPLVHSIVKKFSNTGIDYQELLSAGWVGYWKALQTFTKGKNVKFSTYAYRCIQNEILYFLRKEKRHKDNDISLSLPISTDKNGNIMTVESLVSTEDYGHKSVEQEIETKEFIKILLNVIDEYLNPQEAYIIKNRYGLNGQKPKTQKEIADEIGMSQANVSKLEKGIIDKLKKIMSSKYKIKYL